nr:secretory carrier-associated membrane protein 2-like isoform X1 [Oncorhynchus nerka]XP_029541576.1 secretory carrier-associated membrane protein 2-like isoform X1 [Oncorhynchus nerka]XP_029541577.1 secretory carrier-associated membrane protein 2-like isoform X1 [Oncorhynchus nerka]
MRTIASLWPPALPEVWFSLTWRQQDLDPSVTQVTNSDVDHIDQFNPFPDHQTVSLSGPTIPASRIPSQPAVLQPSTEPGPQVTEAAGQASLLRQQEELEQKAADLEHREKELQNRGTSTGKDNNWPPLPKAFPINPCFYQDFSVEIPMEHRRVCQMLYYLWMLHCVTLFLNLLACLLHFTVNTYFGMNFGLSILWLILFAPCSFLCWYRPVYKAFKSDSSFSYFFFFFVFFCQVVVFIIQSVGIPNWGNSGWITSLSAIGSNKAVGAIMMVVAYFFTACAVLSVILLGMVHSQYRRTGASFQKAQQEFSQGVLTNKTFQTAATSAAASAAFQGNN